MQILSRPLEIHPGFPECPALFITALYGHKLERRREFTRLWSEAFLTPYMAEANITPFQFINVRPR